jgi:hypothetical protein
MDDLANRLINAVTACPEPQRQAVFDALRELLEVQAAGRVNLEKRVAALKTAVDAERTIREQAARTEAALDQRDSELDTISAQLGELRQLLDALFEPDVAGRRDAVARLRQ